MTSFQLELTSSPHFVNWLQQQDISLAFTTYQSNRLFLVGVKPNGRLSAFERLFDRPMGIYAQGHDLYMGSAYQLWKLSNVLEPGQIEPGGYDALYVPRAGWTTGDISIHDVALDNAGEAVMVNTAFSCLVKLDDRFSFKPIWQPKFVSRLVPEDRCHLNGLAMVDGMPGYVTAVSQSDTVEGWRSHRRDGGVLIDVISKEVVASGLSMPHSPRFYRDKLWVLNSGRGDFGYIDLATGKFEPVTFCAGFTRGLAFHGDYALIGTSKPRDKCFKGLDLEDRLSAAKKKAKCGLIVVDLRSGEIVHWFDLEGDLTELFDVAILPGIRQPTALGFKNDELARTINIPGFRGVLGSRQDEEKTESESANNISPFLPKPRPLSRVEPEDEEISAPETEPSLPNPFLAKPSAFPRLETLKNIDFGFNSIEADSEVSVQLAQNPRNLFQQGKAALKQGQLPTAAEHFQNAIKLHPNYVAAYNQLGQVLQALGHTEQAIAVYQDALKIDPSIAPLHCNLGSIWQLQGKIERALDAYGKALEFKPDLTVAYLNRGRLLAQQQQYSLAIKDFQKLVELQPQSAEVYYHYGNVLGQQRQFDKAIATLTKAIALQPDYGEAYNSLGYCYQQQGEIELARQHYLQALQIKPDLPGVLYQLGSASEYIRDFDAAQTYYQQALQQEPHNTKIAYDLSLLQRKLCNWENYDRQLKDFLQQTTAHLNQPDAVPLFPLTANYFPVPQSLHLAIARSYAQSIKQNISFTFTHSQPKTNKSKLRIGYISPDFCSHAVGVLIQDLFQHHNRNSFEIYTYSLKHSEDVIQAKVKATCDSFVDLSNLPNHEAAQLIHDDAIDILIDLAGYTTYARPEILAYQPAPIQCSYLGYSDTMGADFIQYILADKWLMPPDLAQYYSEKVVYLPQGFIGSPLAVADKPMTRSQFGLPENSFVFCCFNAHHKIEPEVFSCWMKILQQVPNSVLWLSQPESNTTKTNLFNYAQQQGINPKRLNFAPKLPHPEYLARYQLADLFLDTFSYSAGSTAVCAMWAGIPLLTKAGNTYASRMGASICAAAGMSDTICHSPQEYVTKAIHYATHPQELTNLRQQLQQNQTTMPLFNLPQFTIHLEQALTHIWQEYSQPQLTLTT